MDGVDAPKCRSVLVLLADRHLEMLDLHAARQLCDCRLVRDFSAKSGESLDQRDGQGRARSESGPWWHLTGHKDRVSGADAELAQEGPRVPELALFGNLGAAAVPQKC